MKTFLLSIALTLASSGFAQEMAAEASTEVSTTGESVQTSSGSPAAETESTENQANETQGSEEASETATEGASESAAPEATEGSGEASETATESASEPAMPEATEGSGETSESATESASQPAMPEATEGSGEASESATEGASEPAMPEATESFGEASETATEGTLKPNEPEATEGAGEATSEPTELEPVTGETGESAEPAYEHPLPVRCHHAGDVALTFDDGPGQYTGEVLAKLKKNRVLATFHVAKKMLGDVEMVEKLKEAMADGHNIGLRFDPEVTAEALAAMSQEEFHQKLVAESESFRHHFGVYPRLLRMPYGYKHLDKTYHDIVDHKGFIVSSWTIDSKDYIQELSPEDLVEIAYEPILLVDEESKEHFGQIEESFIVLHRDIYNIAPAVEVGIKLVEEEGAGRLRFVTLGECLDVDNVYKRDVEGQHGFVGANGEPVPPKEPELYEPEVAPETTGSENEGEESDPIDEFDDDQEPEVYAEPENEVNPEEETQTNEGGAGDFTQNLDESSGGAYGYGGMGSAIVAAALAAVFA